jgi:gamma-glutamyltranspeptidase/glutathione hydrolase
VGQRRVVHADHRADRWLGITVPGRGFILNNELTDFSPVYDEADPNRIEGGKRPRSSMSPTLVLRDGSRCWRSGRPVARRSSPRCCRRWSTATTSACRCRGRSPRPAASQRNSPTTTAEQAFIDRWGPALETYGHDLALSGEAGTSAADIGAVAAVQIGPNGGFVAVAEPRRRGGGSALVVRPSS